jgi:hypothetical protein
VTAAQDTVGLSSGAVDHLYPGFAGPLADEIAVIAGPALPPKAPGEGIEQGRLACPIGATNAGSMDPTQIQNGMSITEKIVQG